jgi:predicted SAM-dependent methyltransferase
MVFAGTFSIYRPLGSYLKVQHLYSRIIRGRSIQLRKIDLRSKQYLNVGCGGNIFENFINLDYQWRPNLDLCWDITRGIPLDDNSLAGIFTEHCLEHIPYAQVCEVLKDFGRMLRSGGTLRIVVPDAELYVDIYERQKAGEKIDFPNGSHSDNALGEDVTPMMIVNRVFRDYGHQFAYDYKTLEVMLKRVGFVDIRQETFLSGRDKALLIDSKKRAHESLYVEASKP